MSVPDRRGRTVCVYVSFMCLYVGVGVCGDMFYSPVCTSLCLCAVFSVCVCVVGGHIGVISQTYFTQ